MSFLNRRRSRGSAAIEFALTAPILAILTFGAFDYCWYFVQGQTVIVSAQVGARAGSQTKMADAPDVAAADAAVEALGANYMGPVPSGTAVTGQIVDGDMVEVDILVPFTPLVGYVALPDRISVQSRMLIEDNR